MIPSRGLRWSSQSLGLGRRRIEAFSARHFSSSVVQNAPIRSSPLLSQQSTSVSRPHPRFQLSRPNLIIRNGAAIRFASTTPLPAAATSVDSSSIATPPASSDLVSNIDLATDLTTDSLANVPVYIGYLKSIGLDYGWGPTAIMEWTLEHIHVFAGTPWWVSISLTALLVRVVLFKPYVDAAENGTRLQAVAPITKPLTVKMNEARINGDTAAMMQLQADVKRIHQRAGIKMYRSFVPFLQGFAAYGTFVLLRGMAKLPVPSMETGGALWFYNLTVPDPYVLLPLATAGVLHWVLRKGGETGTSTLDPSIQKALMWGFPGLSLAFTWWLPAGAQLSFFVAGLLSFAQVTIMRQTWFRRYFGMTPLPERKSTATQSPYKGTMKIAAPNAALSQKELNSRFESTSSATLRGTTADATAKEEPKSALRRIMKSALKPLEPLKEASDGVMSKANERMAKNREKSVKSEAQKYEEKRKTELRNEMLDRQERERHERALRKNASRND